MEARSFWHCEHCGEISLESADAVSHFDCAGPGKNVKHPDALITENLFTPSRDDVRDFVKSGMVIPAQKTLG